jgi:hypothetical protein
MANRGSWFDKVGARDQKATFGDCQPLEFTHGIEVECFLVDKKGEKLTHAKFEEVYNSIISRWLVKSLEGKIPTFYANKVVEMNIGPSKSSTYDAVKMAYMAKNEDVSTELISVDRNVAEWPLLELATPPCESLYELAWWSHIVFNLILESLRRDGGEYNIMLFGVNPYETVGEIVQSETFPTCGEHHHIKVVEDTELESEERALFTNFYHLLRFFTSHLILLSVCSPFASGTLWGKFRPNDQVFPFPGCVRSIRVLFNKKHLCSFQDGEYMPYLEEGWQDKKYFIKEFKSQSSSFRTDTHFFDMDPLSHQNRTTEIRFFDSQPSIARRVGMAAVIQMMAKKAKNMISHDPDHLLEVLKEPNSNLQSLKKMACEGGFWFRPPMKPILGEDVKLKPSKINRIIFSDLVLEMMFLLKNEIHDSHLIYSHFMDPIRHSIYDLDGNGVSPAQYWLFTYVKEGQNMDRVVKKILDCSKHAGDIWYDPVVDEPIELDYVNGMN